MKEKHKGSSNRNKLISGVTLLREEQPFDFCCEVHHPNQISLDSRLSILSISTQYSKILSKCITKCQQLIESKVKLIPPGTGSTETKANKIKTQHTNCVHITTSGPGMNKYCSKSYLSTFGKISPSEHPQQAPQETGCTLPCRTISQGFGLAQSQTAKSSFLFVIFQLNKSPKFQGRLCHVLLKKN